MNTIFSKISSLFRKVGEAYKNHTRTTWLATGVLFVAIGTIFFGFESDEQTQNTQPQKMASVETASVRALSRDESRLSFLGEVRSTSQVELRAQRPGEITGVYVKAGQFVQAGAIIGEMENAAERAAVLSAQGSVAAAQAQLDKVISGARGEDKASTVVQAQAAITTLGAAQDSARNAYSQAYTLAQNAVYANVDDFFSNPYTVNPSFRIRSASFEERQQIETERVRIGEMLDEWELEARGNISNENLNARLLNAENNLQEIKQFLIRISKFISEQETGGALSTTEKVTQEATIQAARTSIDTARSTVNGARTGLANAISAAQVAKLTESKTVVGARSEDVAVAEASLTQARGSLASVYAALENTLFRSPISGTVTTLNINIGDYVTSLETVALVANEGALEIESYVSEKVRKRISVGQNVLIDGTNQGVITSVSPGLDPTTKKARVMIGVNESTELVNGAYVSVEVMIETEKTTPVSDEVVIPITAVKVLPRNFAVFVVNEENIIESVPITEGPIVGDKMIIPDGLEMDMEIVIDARGILEGQKVEVVTEQE